MRKAGTDLIMNNYIDKHGRWHTKPVTESDPYPTNNAYIYSFYAQMVGIPVKFDQTVIEELLFLRFKPISRHPGGYHIPISHDEYVGLAGSDTGLDQGRADRIVEFGKKNYFQYCDLKGFVPTPFYKLNIHNVIEGFEELKNEENPRTAVIKYPSIWNIAFWHRPEHQYFYYRCANRSPGIVRTLVFIGASLFTIRKKGQTSVMLGFKLLKLMEKPNLADHFVNLVMNKYGDFKGAAIKYFPKDHPILMRLLK
jgi:hypothetical protein